MSKVTGCGLPVGHAHRCEHCHVRVLDGDGASGLTLPVTVPGTDTDREREKVTRKEREIGE